MVFTPESGKRPHRRKACARKRTVGSELAATRRRAIFTLLKSECIFLRIKKVTGRAHARSRVRVGFGAVGRPSVHAGRAVGARRASRFGRVAVFWARDAGFRSTRVLVAPGTATCTNPCRATKGTEVARVASRRGALFWGGRSSLTQQTRRCIVVCSSFPPCWAYFTRLAPLTVCVCAWRTVEA